MGEQRLERRVAARALARAELSSVNVSRADVLAARTMVVDGEIAGAPVSDTGDHNRVDIESEPER